MPSLGGITARILCDGEPLEEYATSVDPTDLSVVSCWVASNADKQFKLEGQIKTQESCGWSCTLYCDGLRMRGALAGPKSESFQINEARDGKFLRSMVFSEILETDNQEAAEQSINPLLGVIQLQVWRIEPKWRSVKVQKSKTNKKEVAIDESPVHESKKMLGGHRVKLGPPNLVKSSTHTNHTTRLDKKPYKVFTFYYRPKSLLRAMGHAPPSPPKSVKNLKRSASELSDDSAGSETDGEEDKIAAQMRILQQKKDEIRKKKEAKRGKDGHSASKRLKREAVEIVVPAATQEEIIELSSD